MLVDEIDGVKIIILRRPQAMNVLTDEVTGDILSVLEKGVNDPSVKGFVITGYGINAFSAGADIGKFPEMLGDREASIQYTRDCAKVQAYMDRIEKPVVAALNGMALDGGLEVALRCHEIVSTKKAYFQFPEITPGIESHISCVAAVFQKRVIYFMYCFVFEKPLHFFIPLIFSGGI